MSESIPGAREALERLVLNVADYPEPGINFKDITPVLADSGAFRVVVDALASAGRDAAGAVHVDKVVGMESRGFIVGAPVALALGVGFVPVRKAGKLPRETHGVTYDLEYGSATLEIHQDALAPGERVLLVDDVLATGGTAAATMELITKCGALPVAVAVLYELAFLSGRDALNDLPLLALAAV